MINPIGALPIYLAIAAPLAPPAQRKVAVSAVLISLAVLVFFIVAGEFLLGRMNIPIRAFQISGGIVLFLVAIEMIRGETPILAPKAKENHVALAVYPLAIPKIAGPGAMLTVIMLTDDDRLNIMGQLVTVGVLVGVLVIQLLVLLAAAPVSRLIGVAGAAVVSRVMGMLLAALAVSIVLTALGQWLNLPQL